MNKEPVFQNKKILSIFKDEISEHIQNIINGLLVLKDDPKNKKILEGIAREAHTIKGTSRMMQFVEVSEMAHKIEVFTAGCPLCSDTLKAVKEASKECGCEITEHRCEGSECCEPAKSYDIKAVPSIVIDGKVAHVGKLSAEEFKRYI